MLEKFEKLSYLQQNFDINCKGKKIDEKYEKLEIKVKS